MMFSGKRTPGTTTPKKRKKKGQGSKRVYYEDSPEKYPMGTIPMDSSDYKGSVDPYVDYGGMEQSESPVPLLKQTPAPADEGVSPRMRGFVGSPLKKKDYVPLRGVSPVPFLAPIERGRSPSPIRRPLTSPSVTSPNREPSLPRVVAPAPSPRRVPDRQGVNYPPSADAQISTISYSQPRPPEGEINVITPTSSGNGSYSPARARPAYEKRPMVGRQTPLISVPAGESAYRVPVGDGGTPLSSAAAVPASTHIGVPLIPPIQQPYVEEDREPWELTPPSPLPEAPTPAPRASTEPVEDRPELEERPKTAAGFRRSRPTLIISPEKTQQSQAEMINPPPRREASTPAPIARPESSPEEGPNSPAKIAVTQVPAYQPPGSQREKSPERENTSPDTNISPKRSPPASPSKQADPPPTETPDPEKCDAPKQYMLNSLNDKNLNKERSRAKHADDDHHKKSHKKSKKKDRKRAKHNKGNMNITEGNSGDPGKRSCKHVSIHPESTSEPKEGSGDESNGSDDDESPWVKFNVGGAKFATKSKTLNSQPDSRLGKLAKKVTTYPPDPDRVFTFDRNPSMFGYILDFYRDGHLHVPQSMCIKYFKDEMAYWGINENSIAECCWERFKATDDDDIVLGQLERSEKGMSADVTEEDSGCRGRLWRVLDQPKSSTCAQLWALFYVLLVLVSTTALLCDSHPDFRVASNRSVPDGMNNSKKILLATTDSHPGILYAELITTLIFSIEFLLRLASCPQRMLMAKDVLTWTELTSVIAQWNILVIVAIYPDFRTDPESIRYRMVDMSGTLRVLRVLRLFRLARHYKGLRVFMLAMQASATELLMLAILLIIFIIMFSTMIYYAELDTDDGQFKNIPECFWWAIITMTTVGYGDVYPTSDAGYVVGSLCAVAGLLATGLPIPIIATNFQLYYTYSKMRDRIMSKNDSDSVVNQALNKLMFFKSSPEQEHVDENTQLKSTENSENPPKAIDT